MKTIRMMLFTLAASLAVSGCTPQTTKDTLPLDVVKARGVTLDREYYAELYALVQDAGGNEEDLDMLGEVAMQAGLGETDEMTFQQHKAVFRVICGLPKEQLDKATEAYRVYRRKGAMLFRSVRGSAFFDEAAKSWEETEAGLVAAEADREKALRKLEKDDPGLAEAIRANDQLSPSLASQSICAIWRSEK